MFGSPSIKIHIARGVLGFGFLSVVLLYAPVWGWWTLIPAIGALICFGGCPLCWIAGFVGTILNGEPASLCLDGSCTTVRSSGSQVRSGETIRSNADVAK